MIYIMFWPIAIVEVVGMVIGGFGILIEWFGGGARKIGEAMVDKGFDWEDRCS